MKLVVVGMGQGGARIADEFAVINRRAMTHRRIDILTDIFAANTDKEELRRLRNIRSDFRHRILLGEEETGGHGAGRMNDLGAQIARKESDKVVNAVSETWGLFESDAFLVIASASGGTGSAGLPIITQAIKERYGEKPVYAMVVLPFEHEEHAEGRCVYNTATCLKATYSVADAVFLVDNQRYLRNDANLIHNMRKINQQIAESFYNLLCCGEEKKRKHIGARMMDAGDIIQTLGGWSTIAIGRSKAPLFRSLSRPRRQSWRHKVEDKHKGLAALDEALGRLPLVCQAQDVRSALYLLTSPVGQANMDIFEEIGDYLKELMEQAIIRRGDYPREMGILEVTIVLSQISDVERVRGYYYRFGAPESTATKRRQVSTRKLNGKDVLLPNVL